MKRLEIEWKHIQTKGDTCIRCADTGEELDVDNVKPAATHCKHIQVTPAAWDSGKPMRQRERVNYGKLGISETTTGCQLDGTCPDGRFPVTWKDASQSFSGRSRPSSQNIYKQ
jgi:hypothetical protein